MKPGIAGHPSTAPAAVERAATGRDAHVLARLWARLFAHRYDQQIDLQTTVEPGSPLAVHMVRLVSRREREELAAALTLVLHDAAHPPGVRHPSSRIPIHSEGVAQSADLVRDALARLLGPLPVRARGIARLRLLLTDGLGPMYRPGTASLSAVLRGVLAAL